MSDVTPALDPSVAAVDRALRILQRRLTPRGMRRVSDEHHYTPGTDAISLLYAISSDDAEVTVGGVAEAMCIDPSRPAVWSRRRSTRAT